MDEEVSISQLAELDTSALIATEKLVTCLRGCMLFATTPEASRVRLGGSRYSDHAQTQAALNFSLELDLLPR